MPRLNFSLPIVVLLLLTHSLLAQNKKLPPNEILTGRSNAATQSFVIEAKKDQVISLEIKQNGIDLEIKLFSPENSLLAESDNPFSEQDTERVFVIADETGNYRLEIKSKFPDEKGTFNLKLNDLHLATANDFKRAEAEKLFSKAQILRTTGKTADRKAALQMFEQSLALWQEAKDEFGEIRTLINVSYLNRILGNNEKSAELANLILKSPNLPEYTTYKADALYQIAQTYSASSKMSKAIKTLEELLALYPNPAPEKSIPLATLAFYHQRFDDTEKAQNLYLQSFENIKRFPDIYSEAQARHQFALFNFDYNELEEAVKNFKLAGELRKKGGYIRGYAISMTFLAMTYQRMERFPESLELLEKAFQISVEFGDVTNQLDTLIYLARAHREAGNYQKALEMYQKAESLNGQTSNSLYLSLATTYLLMSNFTESRKNFELALALYRQKKDVGGESLTLFQYAALERAENNLDAAKAKIERSLKIVEDEQTSFRNSRQLTSFLVNRRSYFDLYIDVLMRLDEQRPNENFAFKALQASENARMRTLIWQLREALKNSPQSVDYQLFTQIQKNQQQLGEQLSQLAKAQSTPNKNANISEIENSIVELNKQNESLKAQLRKSNPNFANLAQPPTLSLEQMQTELDDDAALVEYSLGEQRSYLWIVTKNNFQSFVLPKGKEIEAQARNFYETLIQSDNSSRVRPLDKKQETKQPPIKNFKEEAEKLSHMIRIEKLANLSAKRLIFVADGALNLIPFSSLTLSETNPTVIADKFETSQLPSLTTLQIIRQQNIKPFASNSLAIIADPVFSMSDERLSKKRNKQNTVENDLAATLRDFSLTSIPRLPFSRIEAQKIADSLPNNSVLNLDFKASRERLLNGEFDRYDILHFATHGFLNNEHPELSGLVLSLVDEKGNQQNGFLRTQDLYLLKIKPQMVVLSACQTGLGKQVGNEGLIGLTRGFLANGTPRIISTLWKVDDAATAEFMSRFYRALLKENQKPAAALKTAQNELKAIPRYAHPRYWAGFVLTGEWR